MSHDGSFSLGARFVLAKIGSLADVRILFAGQEKEVVNLVIGQQVLPSLGSGRASLAPSHYRSPGINVWISQFGIAQLNPVDHHSASVSSTTGFTRHNIA